MPSTPAFSRFPTVRLLVSTLALSALVVFATPAAAQTWNEVGDAGGLPGTAQNTAGTGSITKINGTLGSVSDIDMYCVRISDLPSFFAGIICAVHADADLYLFNSAGKGVALTQICSGGMKQVTSAFVGSTGPYYFAVAGHGALAFAGPDAIWLAGTTTQRAPDGPGAAGAVTSWGGSPVASTIPSYTINLSGTSYCNFITPAQSGTWGRVRTTYR